jgi:UDP-GlcNAc:undecaprenyl-phosphate/decaprenyl-phosphate GlcNAc-1-phosphate transferase
MMLDLHRYADVVFAVTPIFLRFSWIGLALATAALSAGLTALLVRIAPSRGWVVLPAENRWNRRVVAQFGGIPILLATCTVVAVMPATHPVLSLFFLTLGMALLGFVDDVVGLGPKPKLVVEILLAVLAVHSGIVHPLSGSILLNAAFTVFWIVGITNAFNLIDNIDGLASGIAIIALAQIVLLTGLKLPVGMLALYLMASVFGFLLFNFHPAKIFMGDVGSLAIGFFLACASVLTASHLSSLGAVLLVPCLVLFIPIFDMLLVSITRRINGRAISRGARDHSSHRLVLLGLTERQAVWILYTVAFIAGLLAFCWERFWPEWGAGFLTLFLVGASLFWLYLAKLELPEKWLSESNVLIIRVPAFFLRIMARLSALLFDGIIIILAFYFACLSNLQKQGSFFLLEFWIAAVGVVVIKLAFLAACGVYQGKWSLSRLKDTLPFFRAVLFSACFILVAWLVLPSHHGLPVSIVLSDAGLSAALLLLTRASTQLFDLILGGLRPLPAATEPFSTKLSEANPVAQFTEPGFTDEPSRKM